MIVVCVCGQKNRVKAELATGAVTAKEVNCGHCKTSLRKIMQDQVDRNSNIVLDLVTMFQDPNYENTLAQSIIAIFTKNGVDVLPELDENEGDADDDAEEDEDEDDEDDDEEEAPPVHKRKVVKKKEVKKKKKKTVGRDVH